MALTQGTRIGPYEIRERIGAGGMGEVYRARDERLARDVAVKVLPPSFLGDADRLRRFEQEARAAGQLNHPNILAVHDAGSHEGAPYVVQELLEGETLRDRIRETPLPPRKAIDFARQIAEGLAAAHMKGIVHRDLKPENLFVTRDGRVKILDFGLAKLTGNDDVAANLSAAPTQMETGAGVVLGTAGYMSPEQVRGQPADHRSDIFSFGAILHEMLTGRRAFEGESSVETMNAILKQEPPEVSSVVRDAPPGLDRIVEHCLEKRPDERFQSARDLAFQLEALSETSPSGIARSAATALRPGGGRARRALAAALALAALAAAFFIGRGTRPEPASPTYSQMTFRQGSLFSARFTPDGQSVVYGAAWDGGPAELYSTRPGSPESRALGLTRAEILAVSPTGEMAILMNPTFTIGWMRGGTLARVPLAGGVPRPVLENVQDADWGPDGKSLIVARSVGGRYRLEHPIGDVLYETTGWISSPRLSRDGKRIAFLHHPGIGDNRGQVGLVDLRGRSTMLTDPFSSSGGLAWSPSGEEIWFTAGRTGNVRALHAVGPEGRQRTVDGAPADLSLQDVAPTGQVLLSRNTARRGIMGLAPGESTERDLSWLDWSRPGYLSADGEWLLFEEQGQGGGPEFSVYLRPTNGGPAVRLGEGTSTALSPDGRWAMAIPVDRTDRLVILPRGVGTPRTIDVPGFDLVGAEWLPDGERILLLGGKKGGLLRLFLLDTEGGTPRPISPEGLVSIYALSADGEFIAASPIDEALRLYPVAGGDARPVPGAGPEDRALRWSSDGASLFVTRLGELPARIERLDLMTGRRTLWKELLPDDRAGLLDIGFMTIAPDGRAYAYSYRRILSTLYHIEGLR